MGEFIEEAITRASGGVGMPTSVPYTFLARQARGYRQNARMERVASVRGASVRGAPEWVEPEQGTPDWARPKSFDEYCRLHFVQDWVESLKGKIVSNMVPLGKLCASVPEPDYISVLDVELIRINFSRMDRLRFYADAIMAAKIELTDCSGGEIHKGVISQWYQDRFIFQIYRGGFRQEEQSVSIYDSSNESPGLPLTEYLIPVLDRESKEIEADEILRQYYPEALLSPQQIDAWKLANRMGLRVVEAPIYTDQGIMGLSIFYNGTIAVTHNGGATVSKMRVEPGMIILNSLCVMDDIQKASTIIHECIHFYEHDLFVWVQTLYSRDFCGIEYPVTAADQKSPVYWAETQARMITYRVKMNRMQTENIICSLKEEIRAQYPNIEDGYLYEKVIGGMSAYFGTSKKCAKKRMLELGHEYARGVLDYVNGKYVPPYFCAPGILADNRSFVISLSDAAIEYGRNERFKELINSGRYVYVEGKFCQNKPEYVRKTSDGKLYLTQEARNHVEVCCLLFEYIYGDPIARYFTGHLNRETQPTVIDGRKIVSPQMAAIPGLFDPRELLREATWITKVRKEIAGMDFGEALVYLMKQRRCTIEKLEERSLLSCRTISRLRNEPEYPITWSHILALSVGLTLPPAISGDMVAKAGLRLRNSVNHNVYQILLNSCFEWNIDTVNSYLTELNMEPLTEMAKVM